MKSLIRIRRRNPVADKSQLHSAAFTLVELLVSLSILAIIVVFFGQALGGISSAWGTAQEKMDNFAKARTTLTRIQVDLQNLVARDDLANFGRRGTGSTLGFYTLQRGPGTGTAPRSLSYVEYSSSHDSKNLPILMRQSNVYTYADGDAPDFLPAPTPSLEGTAAEPTPNAVDASGLDDLVATRGLLAFTYGFLHPDGKYTDSYYENSSGNPSRAIAVKVGMIVADPRTVEILDERNKLGSLCGAVAAESEPPPSGTNWSPKAIWDYQLGLTNAQPVNPGGTGSSPSRLDVGEFGASTLDGIRSFERTYSFPSNLPSLAP